MSVPSVVKREPGDPPDADDDDPEDVETDDGLPPARPPKRRESVNPPGRAERHKPTKRTLDEEVAEDLG